MEGGQEIIEREMQQWSPAGLEPGMLDSIYEICVTYKHTHDSTDIFIKVDVCHKKFVERYFVLLVD